MSALPWQAPDPFTTVNVEIIGSNGLPHEAIRRLTGKAQTCPVCKLQIAIGHCEKIAAQAIALS
ncbi:hypothetical protein [Paraburkholderia sp. JHI869]|uniref:hypothetical protein n=1 Tax=Paraburkholderia sp. JHI869 TaxID=3112959 RepID=UPI00317EF024